MIFFYKVEFSKYEQQFGIKVIQKRKVLKFLSLKVMHSISLISLDAHPPHSLVNLVYCVCVWHWLKELGFLLFNLFLLLFMDSITLFGTIHGSYCTISTTF